jgi:hypothetical protein
MTVIDAGDLSGTFFVKVGVTTVGISKNRSSSCPYREGAVIRHENISRKIRMFFEVRTIDIR